MRFLADAGISPKTVEFLRLRGHDAVHVRDLALQRATDIEIAARARAESRVLLTFDLDFGEILALGVVDSPSVVIFRLADERADAVNQRLAVVLSEQSEPLASGVLVLVEDARYRVRRLPIRKPAG
jgi:predicted nuclease of predicted toxin-antitoxin system